MYRIQLSTYSRVFKGLIVGCAALFSLLKTTSLSAQPNTTIDLKKPQKFESRELPSEKTGQKKFTAPRRIYNNTVSRFNYYFNANNKLNEIIDKAKALQPDDYTQLLPFYKYSLDVTAKDHTDSVIYKTTAGILLHDLRSDWVDKLYLLMGKAYMLHKDFDSATIVFQYINYAFAPKDDGYDIPIGSNASNTNGVFTVATKENRKLWKRIISVPPSRNESFVLQARNYIEQGKYLEAASLLELFRSDPNFPQRLQSYLHETTAYVLYKQEAWEAAARELLKALEKPDEPKETGRWEYLAGQLFAKAGNSTDAIALFERSIKHSPDPILEIYARLSIVNLSVGNEAGALQHHLDELLKMARRDKYESTRDIIYYAAAGLELRRKNYKAAQELLLKSIQYNINNPVQRQLSFLLLGDLNYTRKSYEYSYAFYDSTQVSLLKEPDRLRVNERKPALEIITKNIAAVAREDSLQKLASMGVEDRNNAVKKILKQLRREKGLKDLAASDSLLYGNPNYPPPTAPTFVLPGQQSTGADFYFLNANLRAKGVGEFKTKWGNRPNIDNWRRQAIVDRNMNTATPVKDVKTATTAADDNLTFDALYKKIPLTSAQHDSSDRQIIRALMENGLTFQNRLEDYPSAIEVYEELMRRFPESAEVEQALFNLAYAYRKNNEPEKADRAMARLKSGFAGGKYTQQAEQAAIKKTDPAKKRYEDIYRMFIEGRFDEAKEAKLQADKQFGKTYWTPQLLYIESIYYIKQRQDSVAINRLQNITSLFAKTTLAEKAQTMIDVLKKRKEIENYLTNLKVDRKEEDVTRGIDLDSINPFTGLAIRKYNRFTPPDQLNARAKNLANITDVSTANIDKTAPPKDSVKPIVALKSLDINSVIKKEDATIRKNGFTFNVTDTQYVIVILDKVDPIFVSEGRNAFNRFNQERFPGQRILLSTQKFNDQVQFLLIGPFNNSVDALNYVDRTRPLVASRIVPWLSADKYSFTLMSSANMQVLLQSKDLAGYKAFIQQVFPDKF